MFILLSVSLWRPNGNVQSKVIRSLYEDPDIDRDSSVLSLHKTLLLLGYRSVEMECVDSSYPLTPDDAFSCLGLLKSFIDFSDYWGLLLPLPLLFIESKVDYMKTVRKKLYR